MESSETAGNRPSAMESVVFRRFALAFCQLAFLALALASVASNLSSAQAAEASEKEQVPGNKSTEGVQYEVVLVGAPNPESEVLLKESLNVFRYQENGAPSLPLLRRRAKGDADTAKRVLSSQGYYNAKVTSLVEASESEKHVVEIKIEPGDGFILEKHEFAVDHDPAGPPPTPLDAKALGSPVGKIPQAQLILSAEASGLRRLQQSGYPYAKHLKRTAQIDPGPSTLSVLTSLDAGRQVRFGGG